MPDVQSMPASAITPDIVESATTSVNGSTATTETVATEISVPNDPLDVTSQELSKVTPEPQRPVAAAPKPNPWKVRAEQISTSPAPKSMTQANGTRSKSNTNSIDKPLSPIDFSTISNGVSQSGSQTQKKVQRPAKSTAPSAPAIDDASLWPSLDKASEERQETHHKRPSDAGEREVPSAPKVTGKEKWTKITPTIIHNPIPSKSSRGGSTSKSASGRGGASLSRNGREKAIGEKNDDGSERVKASRASDTSKTRQSKPRSMSATNSRADRASRGSQSGSRSTDILTHQRSHSTKRSDRGSVSAPNGTTPVSDVSKSPQVDATANGFPSIDSMPFAEPRPHRGSYDSNVPSRGRGGFRGGRGGYQNNSNTSYGQQTANSGNHQASASHSFQSRQYPQRYNQREQYQYAFDPYQVMSPNMPMMMDPLMARQLVLNQCEYYFSIENLCKDLFLRKHMDNEGFVNLPILAKFNRIRNITMDYALIRDVCAMSSQIELRMAPGAYDKIRKNRGWEQWVLAEDQRDPSTKMVPESVPEIPVSQDEAYADQGRNIGAPAFVPGQVGLDQQYATNTLNENFSNLGISRLSPEVAEFKSEKNPTPVDENAT